MTTYIYDSLTVDDITQLKTLTGSTTPKRVNKLFLNVLDIGDGTPDFYTYFSSVSNQENLPYIVRPNDNVGGWLRGGSIPEEPSGNSSGSNLIVMKDSNYTITTNGERIGCKLATSEIPFAVQLPANATIGWEVEIYFFNGSPVEIYPNGKLLQDYAQAFTVDESNRGGKLLFDGVFWFPYSFIGTSPLFNIIYP
jgi:hypothetical protein